MRTDRTSAEADGVKPVTIGMAGGSGFGKTTAVQEIGSRAGLDAAARKARGVARGPQTL